MKLTSKRKVQIIAILVVTGAIHHVSGVLGLLFTIVSLAILWAAFPRKVKIILEYFLTVIWGCVLAVLFPIYRMVFSYNYTYIDINEKTSTKTRTLPPRPSYPHKRIVCISDTHTLHKLLVIPDGDFLIFCGDLLLKNGGFFTINSTSYPPLFFRSFNEWLGTLPHPNKIVIGGNHDRYLNEIGRQKVSEILTNAVYLEFKAEKIDGIKFLGIPISPVGKSNNKAWQYTGEELTEIANKLSRDLGNRGVDICLCHSAPFGNYLFLNLNSC